jgi:hypothetical protein
VTYNLTGIKGRNEVNELMNKVIMDSLNNERQEGKTSPVQGWVPVGGAG